MLRRHQEGKMIEQGRALQAGFSRRGALRLGLKAAAFCATPAFADTCPPGQESPVVAAIDARICAAMSAVSLPSVSYALISSGQISTAKAFGVARPNVPASASTLYQAASISKTLAAIGGLAAVQSGQSGLTLDVDISSLETSWRMPQGQQSASHPVTLRRLLGMTAGVNVHGFNGYPTACIGPSPCMLPTLVQILNGGSPSNNPAIQIIDTPSKQWLYSGGGFEIAEALICDTMGTAYGDFVQAKVLTPLNMTNSAWGSLIPQALADEAAYAYVKPGTPVPNRGWNAYPQLAAAGLWTTPSDFAALLLEVGVALAGKGAVLTQASAQAMLTPVDSSQYGLGGAVRNSGQNILFMKSGGNLGFSNWLAYYPALGEGLVVFTNYDEDAQVNWKASLFPKVFSAAARAMAWPDFPGLQDSG
jgi:CubicO group peptidase (beta-lactamase class C family)